MTPASVAPSMAATSATPTTIRHRIADKTCRVCGDKAVGFNFEVVTCESCKAFYRRSFDRTLADFKCPFEKKCVVTAKSRRFCKFCRLKKCYDVSGSDFMNSSDFSWA